MMFIDGLFIHVMDILSTVLPHSAEVAAICDCYFGKGVAENGCNLF
jgi:hypothetical protein